VVPMACTDEPSRRGATPQQCRCAQTSAKTDTVVNGTWDHAACTDEPSRRGATPTTVQLRTDRCKNRHYGESDMVQRDVHRLPSRRGATPRQSDTKRLCTDTLMRSGATTHNATAQQATAPVCTDPASAAQQPMQWGGDGHQTTVHRVLWDPGANRLSACNRTFLRRFYCRTGSHACKDKPCDGRLRGADRQSDPAPTNGDI